MPKEQFAKRNQKPPKINSKLSLLKTSQSTNPFLVDHQKSFRSDSFLVPLLLILESVLAFHQNFSLGVNHHLGANSS